MEACPSRFNGNKGQRMRISLGTLLVLITVSLPAGAALGEIESSVPRDQEVFCGEIRRDVRPGYSLHQITMTNGTVVREYVALDGRVFGVAWQGPFVPNLEQLLGTYFVELDHYARSQTARSGASISIKTEDLVFAGGGHMRSYRGRAYAPRLLPANLSAGVVQ